MTEPKSTGMKTCSKCKETKHALAFSADNRASDGLHSNCRDCVNTITKKSPSHMKAKEKSAKWRRDLNNYEHE